MHLNNNYVVNIFGIKAFKWSLLGSSVHGISQARILEWVAIPFSTDLPDKGIKPGSLALQADSLPREPPGKPIWRKVSQKKKDKYRTLMHIYGIWKDGTHDSTCRAAKETFWTPWRKERAG